MTACPDFFWPLLEVLALLGVGSFLVMIWITILMALKDLRR